MKLKDNLEDAWVACWTHTVPPPNLDRLPPRLWETLRIRLQNMYRRATGEQHATLRIDNEP